ncbi:hypothetical protein [Bacillus toyonensis]
MQKIQCPQIQNGEYCEKVVNIEGSPMGELPVIVVDQRTKK